MIAAHLALLLVALAALAYADTHGDTRAWRALGGRSFRIDACRYRRGRDFMLQVGVEQDWDYARLRGTWIAAAVCGLEVRVALCRPR